MLVALLVLALVGILGAADGAHEGVSGAIGTHVYATLLFSDDFAEAVRVLGASLDTVGSIYPRLCLYTEHVSAPTLAQLGAEGWHVMLVPTVDVPPVLQSTKFRYIYSKLVIWDLGRLVGIERVVFLDGDILARRNIDHMFECGPKFCASERLENYFNGGVFVLETDAAFYAEMMRLLATDAGREPRYTGEQTLLNELLGARLRSGTFFGERGNEALDAAPNTTAALGAPWRGGSPTGFQRLAYSYNAEPLLFALSECRWKFPWDEARGAQRGPHLVHYAGEYVKPWSWWSYLLFTQLWEWHAVRVRLEPRASALYSPLADWLNLAALVVALCALAPLVRLCEPLFCGRARLVVGRARWMPAVGALSRVWALYAAGAFGPTLQATPRLGAAQFCAAYALCVALAWTPLGVAGSAGVPRARAAAEALALYALCELFFAWHCGSVFAKAALIGGAVLVLTHAGAAHARALAKQARAAAL